MSSGGFCFKDFEYNRGLYILGNIIQLLVMQFHNIGVIAVFSNLDLCSYSGGAAGRKPRGKGHSKL